jgi:hypothetical protein
MKSLATARKKHNKVQESVRKVYNDKVLMRMQL